MMVKSILAVPAGTTSYSLPVVEDGIVTAMMNGVSNLFTSDVSTPKEQLWSTLAIGAGMGWVGYKFGYGDAKTGKQSRLLGIS